MAVSNPVWRKHSTSALAILAALALLVLGALATSQSAASARTTSWEVDMLGKNEVPAATSNGYGLALLTFDDVTRELKYEVRMFGLSLDQVTASHIHRAPAGVAGPPIFTLASAPFATTSGSVTLSEADLADLKAGNLYVNIHSVANPAGFARAQLALPGAAPSAPSTGNTAALASDANHAVWAGAGLLALGVVLLAATGGVNARVRQD